MSKNKVTQTVKMDEEFDRTKTEWQEPIKNLYDICKEELIWVYPSSDTEAFLSQIWKQSLEAFDKPREVQIVIDSNDNIYMSVGTSPIHLV